MRISFFKIIIKLMIRSIHEFIYIMQHRWSEEFLAVWLDTISNDSSYSAIYVITSEKCGSHRVTDIISFKNVDHFTLCRLEKWFARTQETRENTELLYHMSTYEFLSFLQCIISNISWSFLQKVIFIT